MNINKNNPVLVTGANGYIASWIVKKLLDQGITVHAAVRDPENKDRVGHLEQLTEKDKKLLKIFKADLLTENSYAAGMQDCELVIHTASPVAFQAKNPQKDLVEPALEGTKNVLSSVQQVKSVKRVVLTSSIAAIIGSNKELITQNISAFTEKHWNTTASLKYDPYSYSKSVAERSAWNICQTQSSSPRWDLVVINPSLVVGPTLSNRMESSLNLMKQLGDGSMAKGTLDLHFGFVDVQDVAEAHIRAGFIPSASGRHIISEHNWGLLEIAHALKDHFGDAFPFPRRTMPKWMAWLFAPMLGLQRRFISENVGYRSKYDNSYSKEDLKLQYQPALSAVISTFSQMIDLGVVKAHKK